MSQTDFRQFENSGRRVVLNTTIMYIQFVLNVLIGLISVRLILKALGQSDYGLYDVIAGVISLFSFITASLSLSTMRFISVGLGAGGTKDSSEVFNACFWLHLIIALIICFLLEAAALICGGSLNIPPERLTSAIMVFHCMVISLFFNIILSPLNALVSSCENFLFISILAIVDSVLKLCIAISLIYTTYDKLLLYGLLMMAVSILNYLVYHIYSKKKYSLLFYIGKPDIYRIKSLTGFVGWTLIDTFSSTINRQGYAIMFNKFFGTVMNTSFALSRQLEGQVFTISAGVVNSMKPQILKSYGNCDVNRMFRLSLTAGKFGLYMMSFVCIPLIVMMPDVLHLWLGEYPPETVIFSRLLIGACMAEQMTRGLVYANQAMGNIKWFSLIVSLLRLIALPLSIIALLFGYEAWVAILVFFVLETAGSLSRVIILSKISDFKPALFFKDVILDATLPLTLSFLACLLLYPVNTGILWMLFVIALTIVLFVILIFLFGLTDDEKTFLTELVKGFMSKV